MKAGLTEQYDLTLTKREMDELMLALRTYVREFDASETIEEIVAQLDEVHTGPKFGIGCTPTEVPDLPEDGDDEDGGAVAPVGK